MCLLSSVGFHMTWWMLANHFIIWVHIGLEMYSLVLPFTEQSLSHTCKYIVLHTDLWKSSVWRLTWKATWTLAKLKTVKRKLAYFYVCGLQTPSMALQVCVCVCVFMHMCFWTKVQFPRERERDGRQRETWTQTEVKQHSPQLELISSTSAWYLSVCIFQLSSTPLNHVSLNMAEICFQSKVFPIYSFFYCITVLHYKFI